MKTTEFHGRESFADCVIRFDPAVGLKSMGLLLLLVMILTSTGCGFLAGNRSGKSYVINGQRYYILASAKGFKEKGQASWYGEPFHGRKTASGEVYDMNQISAAHKTLPLHTWVEVRNLDNNKVMAVRVNDRGPFVRGRIIDLSRGAAQELGMLNAGVARVRIRAITGEQAKRLAEAAKTSAPATVVASAPPVAPAAATSAAPSAGTGEAPSYGVRALITASSAEAEKHRKIVEKSFGTANIMTRTDGAKTSFTVYVDGLKTRDEAAALKKRLLDKGYATAQLIEPPR